MERYYTKTTKLPDNFSIDDRTRYYLYEGSSATTKVGPWNPDTDVTGQSAYVTALGATGILDTRSKTSDNLTLTLAGGADNLQTTDGSITHLIVCPGNEAGDAAIAGCGSVALGDRGSKSVATLADNATELVLPYNTSGTFGMLRDFSTSANVYTQSISHSKSTDAALTGTGTTPISASKFVSTNTFDLWSEGGSTAYAVGLASGDSDNITLITITSSGTTSTTVDNITDANGLSSLRVSGASDGAYITAQSMDNDTLYAYKVSTAGVISFIGNSDNLTTGVANDEVLEHCTAVHPSGGALTVAWRSDNDSLMSVTKSSGNWSSPNEIATGSAANGLGCDMAYNSLNELFFAAISDNGTGSQHYKSSDNGSTWSAITAKADFGGAAKDITMAIDSDLKLPVIAANANGKITMYALDNSSGSDTWVTYVAEPGSADATTGRLGIVAHSDGSAFAMGYESASGDNATIKIFYDE